MEVVLSGVRGYYGFELRGYCELGLGGLFLVIVRVVEMLEERVDF